MNFKKEITVAKKNGDSVAATIAANMLVNGIIFLALFLGEGIYRFGTWLEKKPAAKIIFETETAS